MNFPSEKDVLSFIQKADTPVSKRELTRAFHIKGDDRRPFKKLLSQLERQGVMSRLPGGRYTVPEGLPAVTSVIINEITIDGDVIARPMPWDEAVQGPPPTIMIMPEKKGHASLAKGDEALVRLKRDGDTDIYSGRVLKRMTHETNQFLGMVIEGQKGYRIQPTDRSSRHEYDIAQSDLNGAKDGDLVFAIPLSAKGRHKKEARVSEVVGHEDDPKVISLIAIYEEGLRATFPPHVVKDAEKLKVPPLGNRTDLRSVPLVTIDGADARDFDDAVFAEPDASPDNIGGFHLIVAIADVSHYVHYGSELDKEAWLRGNSTYFPDRVVPMLPEGLSNDVCSLMPQVERACLAVHMWVDKDGGLLRYKFVRGLMKSAARLTYDQAQAAHDGQRDDVTDPIYDTIIKPLYEAYACLEKARQKRGALDLDLPERQILIDENGDMTGVKNRERLDSHKLIENFMILANVAAASALEDKRAPCIYRVHERPSTDRLETARDFLETFGFQLPQNISEPRQINHLLQQAKDHDYSQLISMMVLRTQAQARYDPNNDGHFGLALKKYAHFTSPIRRYADLFVHRALITAYNLGNDGLGKGEAERISETADHISTTERVSSGAERTAVDRFTAAYLESRVNAEFEGVINGVTNFGLFVTLNDIGADGLVPMRSLPNDYYIHNEEQHALIGRKTRLVFRLGARVRVRIKEAEKLTGSTVFEIVNAKKGADIPGFQLKPHLSGRKKSSTTRHKGKTKTSFKNKKNNITSKYRGKKTNK
ncbi:MAG: ribonuclease R [Micavibrio sp.]|nr:ribonuclease R [Micavibrio sp.]|tara:strand:- start:27875 stop:30166 length:2292 start_codon:yes stop_codon:yes gene_type:complete